MYGPADTGGPSALPGGQQGRLTMNIIGRQVCKNLVKENSAFYYPNLYPILHSTAARCRLCSHFPAADIALV
eukprot:g4456.t1